MSRKSESRHLTNLIHLGMMIDACEALGPGMYKPARADLHLDAMRATRKIGQNAVDEHELAHTELAQCLAIREEAFEDFGRRISRIHGALLDADGRESLGEHLAVPARRTHGAHSLATQAASLDSAMGVRETDADHSILHRSYQAMIESGRELLCLIKAVEGYFPAEDDLKVDAIESWLADLAEKVQLVHLAHLAESHARETRNHALYAPDTGVVDVAAGCKVYLRSAVGTRNPEASRIIGLEFHRKL